ncbi:hypothetical protein RhiirA4_443175 [Rhizophagus irregularis]|uniref:TLDc domain-containing protein n=1 Tax=Rhizophagus irregularis TaxID=588596 RepID=A0A2I1GD22_9GLOM|nr:hypothetical protein RhiirA4_443175 [Rhizophagus irregularis]
MEEDHLIEILKRDDLKLEEIEIWDYLIKWGIKNTDSINNLSKWTSNDFTELEKTLHNCIPYIRFSQMPPNVFNIVSTQFNGILPKDLVDDVLQYFSDPNSKPLLKNLPLRVTVYPFDSKIINAKDAALISSWIDKKKGTPYHLRDIPFRFVLIYRASLEEFKFFHNRCDNKGPTVVIIKVRNSGEIIGGYNPLEWRSIKLNGEEMPSNNSEFYNNHKCKTSDSFIFSLFSSTNGVIPTLSRVSSKKEAIIWCKDKGPCFGLQDLWIQSSSRSGKSKQKSYEKTIINKETFEIEEYEVYQIIDTRFSYYEFIKRIFNEEILYLNDRFFKLFENVYTTYIENRYVWRRSSWNSRGFSAIKPGPDDRQSGIRLRFSANHNDDEFWYRFILYRDYGSRVLFQEMVHLGIINISLSCMDVWSFCPKIM